MPDAPDETEPSPPSEPAETIPLAEVSPDLLALSAEALGQLGDRLAQARHPAEIVRLKGALTRGFYGEQATPARARVRLPRPLFAYQLLERIQKRQISGKQFAALIGWLETEPMLLSGRWFKKFSDLTVRGEDDLVTAFLPSGQSPSGQEIA